MLIYKLYSVYQRFYNVFFILVCLGLYQPPLPQGFIELQLTCGTVDGQEGI